jgi:hypothetical protein
MNEHQEGKPTSGGFTLNLEKLETMEKNSPQKSPKYKLGNKIANLANKFEKKIETQKNPPSFLSARERNQELEQLKKTSTKNAYTSLNFFSDLIEKKKKETNQWNNVKSVVVDSKVTHSPSPEQSVPTSPKQMIKESPTTTTTTTTRFEFLKVLKRKTISTYFGGSN